MQFIVKNEKEMQLIAEKIAKKCVTGDCLALHGNLGVGKTIFASGFINYFSMLDCGKKINIPSPTFPIVIPYIFSEMTVHHYDLYRLNDELEMIELGLDEALWSGITIIEWSENAGSFLPSDIINIYITENVNGTRIIEVQ